MIRRRPIDRSTHLLCKRGRSSAPNASLRVQQPPLSCAVIYKQGEQWIAPWGCGARGRPSRGAAAVLRLVCAPRSIGRGEGGRSGDRSSSARSIDQTQARPACTVATYGTGRSIGLPISNDWLFQAALRGLLLLLAGRRAAEHTRAFNNGSNRRRRRALSTAPFGGGGTGFDTRRSQFTQINTNRKQ